FNKMKLLLVLAAVVGLSEAFLWKKSPEWDELKVKFGVPFSDFNSQPRTVKEAEQQGWTAVGTCAASNGYMGRRYVKDGNSAVMLLFDKNGFIAGIQAGVPKGLTNGFPYPATRHMFNTKGSENVITAYFTNPATICSQGRSSSQFDTEGTGTGMFVQNGPNPLTNFISVPMTETGIAKTKWTKGKCFVGMGQHYWYNTSENMNCENFFPMFLLYTDGKLKGFGWALDADLTSETWEHPPPALFSLFMDPVLEVSSINRLTG
ncbi:unnamed protein product, partial [Owenia fusiformis]